MKDTDHDIAGEFQNFLDNKGQKFYRATAPYLYYRVPSKSPFLYMEMMTLLYCNYNSDEDQYKVVTSLLMNQLLASLIDKVTSKTERDPWGSHSAGFVP